MKLPGGRFKLVAIDPGLAAGGMAVLSVGLEDDVEIVGLESFKSSKERTVTKTESSLTRVRLLWSWLDSHIPKDSSAIVVEPHHGTGFWDREGGIPGRKSLLAHFNLLIMAYTTIICYGEAKKIPVYTLHERQWKKLLFGRLKVEPLERKEWVQHQFPGIEGVRGFNVHTTDAVLIGMAALRLQDVQWLLRSLRSVVGSSLG